MRVSVVTVAYNVREQLERTIESVLGQSYGNVEHIVVDGASKDGTRALLEGYGPRISRWVSEPDKGIYDAMNKGWRLATGDVVGFLNADDVFADSGAIARIAETFERRGADAVYGDLELVAESGRTLREWRSGDFSRLKYHWGWMTPHPVTYVKRCLFEEHGGFRTELTIAADYELMLRFFYLHRASVTYLPSMLVRMAAGGASNGSLRGIARANWQVYQSWRMNGLFTLPTVMLTKPLSKLLQLRA